MRVSLIHASYKLKCVKICVYSARRHHLLHCKEKETN